MEGLQDDRNRVFAWADSNNMKFNSEKFKLLLYGNNQEIKLNNIYFSADENIVDEK